MMSLIEVGTPSRSPRGSRFRQRVSEARAAASAAFSSTRLKQLRTGFSFATRSSTARVASTGESAFVR